MNDTYYELIVKRKMSSTSLLIRFLVVVVTAIAFMLGMLILNIYGLIVGFFLAYLDIIIFRNTDTEYEYQFISGDLDIDIIYGKAKRKKLNRYDMRKIEIFSPTNSAKLASYNNGTVKVLDYSSGYLDRLTYSFIIDTNDGHKTKVIFEPNEKLINAIKTVAGSKVNMY